jgi:large subunit ribosomal protein L4
MTLPPNLEIDKRSTCAPSLLNVVKKDIQEEEEEHDDKDVKEDDDSDVMDEDDNDDDEDDDIMDDYEDDDDMLFVRDTSNDVRVISLPDRLHVTVYDKMDATSAVGTLYLSEKLFGHDTIRVDLLQRTVQYQRNQKRGKRKAITKTIGEVSGSGKKVRPQKGSGKARAGHSRPAHWRGGAKAHGPKGSIQDYGACKLNKHVKRLALTHALSQKLKEQNVILVNDLQLESHKTKRLTQLLDQWHIGGRHGTSCYILDHDKENYLSVNLTVASQNIHKIKVSNELRANVYDILKHEKLILTVSAVTALEKRLEGLLRY